MYNKLHFIKLMREIFKKLNKYDDQEITTDIKLLTNPKNYIGGSVTK